MRDRIATILFSLALLGLASEALASSLSQTAADLYRKAMGAKERAEFHLAKALLEQAVESNPDFSDARFELGLVLFELKSWEAAERQFRIVLTHRPSSFEAHNNLAAIYAQQGKEELLGEELNAVVRLNPGYAQGHVNLADYHLTMALRSLWIGYKQAQPGERKVLRTRILKFLAAEPSGVEDQFIQERIARILVEPVPFEKSGATNTPLPGSGRYEIQVYSSRDRAEAEAVAGKLNKLGYAANLAQIDLDGTTWYRIRLRGFPSLNAARGVARQLLARDLIREYWVVP